MIGNIGESIFKGEEINEFGFRHFELQLPMGQPADSWKFWSGTQKIQNQKELEVMPLCVYLVLFL